MNSIIKPSISTLETVNLEQAMQRGRRLRSLAFASFLKALFSRSTTEHGQRVERQGRFAPDCAAPA